MNMKATLDISEKDIKFELENVTLDKFRMIGIKPDYENPFFNEIYPIGKSITLITADMPETLKDAIVEMIKQYCGH